MGRRSSWGWKGIVQGRRILERSMKWRVGDGRSIRLSHDPWLPRPHTFIVCSKHYEMPVMVEEMIDSEVGAWKSDVVRRCFEVEESNLILGLPVSVGGCSDRLIWHYSKDGDYTV